MPEPQEPTFRHWSIVMKDGIMDGAACICHATAGPFFTVGSDATKNCK